MQITSGFTAASTQLLPVGGRSAVRASGAIPQRRDEGHVEATVEGDVGSRRTDSTERMRVQRLDDSGLAPGPARNALATYLAVARGMVPDSTAGELVGIDVIV